MRPLRDIINDARDGKRLRKDEVKLLGEQLHAYWVDRCRECRNLARCDELIEDRCWGCRERVAREGDGT